MLNANIATDRVIPYGIHGTLKMQLSWKPGYSLSNRPVRRSTARRTSRGRLGIADGPQQFVFIAEHPIRDRKTTHFLPAIIYPPSGADVEPITNYEAKRLRT